jgi:hypothetical protein
MFLAISPKCEAGEYFNLDGLEMRGSERYCERQGASTQGAQNLSSPAHKVIV